MFRDLLLSLYYIVLCIVLCFNDFFSSFCLVVYSVFLLLSFGWFCLILVIFVLYYMVVLWFYIPPGGWGKPLDLNGGYNFDPTKG